MFHFGNYVFIFGFFSIWGSKKLFRRYEVETCAIAHARFDFLCKRYFCSSSLLYLGRETFFADFPLIFLIIRMRKLLRLRTSAQPKPMRIRNTQFYNNALADRALMITKMASLFKSLISIGDSHTSLSKS